MNEEYLWDRTGEPDPETVRLETVLGQLKYGGAWRSIDGKRRRPVGAWLLAAAAILVGAIVIPQLLRGPATNWKMADGRRLRAGETIETRAAGASIRSADAGELTIERGSRLRLLESGNRAQRFDLRVGTIHALIWAPPGRFTVDTPSSKTVDLGCQYTLQVSKDGTGLLTVELGWVAFERNKVESFIPAGAACVTRPATGPGTPYFRDAPEALTDALARFDTSGDAAALDAAIAAARRRDALSLWHLMVRTRGTERMEAFDRLSALVRMPPETTRDAIAKGDRGAIDGAWNALELGNTDWWREWKKQW
jgi:hypothetical protein